MSDEAPNVSAFTDAQRDAAEKAYDMLREHFDGSIIIVMATIGEADHQEATRAYYHGGRLQSLGMIEDAKNSLLNKTPEARET